jgi:FtsZ-binding cell division protein ZapB
MTNEELDALLVNLRSAISGRFDYAPGVAHHQWCTRILLPSDDAITALRQERDEALKANSMLLKAASDMEEQRDAAHAENEKLRAECKRISKEIQMCWYGADNYVEAQRGARHCKRLLEAALSREEK